MQYILGAKAVTFMLDGQPKTISRDAEIFKSAMQAIDNENLTDLRELLDIRKSVVQKMQNVSSAVTVKDNRLFYVEREITGLIATRVLEMLSLGLNISPMMKFIENLMNNPSKRAVDETFGFVDACSLPITEDGCILAYRKNGRGYFDSHSHTVLSKPVAKMDSNEIEEYTHGVVSGKENNVLQKIEDNQLVVSMPRNAVDEDKDRTCSKGLHFCSLDYLNHFNGEHILVVKINPADIVAIPSDYNNAKGRCSKYIVVDEIPMNDTGMPEKQITQEYAQEIQNQEYPSAKMTSVMAADFRKRLATEDVTLTALCAEYGISRRQGARIRDFQAWN